MTLNAQPGSAAADKKAALSVVADRDTVKANTANGGETLDGLPPKERSQKVLDMILAELDDDKAQDVVTIDLADKSDIADAMVIASGRSQRHVGAMADKIVRRLKEAGFGRARIEGQPACDWVLIDAEDIIVHIFRPEVRDFYKLERAWSEAARGPAPSDA